jgi:adhesin/invasin
MAAQVDASRSSVLVTPPSVAADGTSPATITITLLDAEGAPVPSRSPVVSVTGSGNILKQPAASSAAGVSLATLASTAVETKTITVTVDTSVLAQHPTVQFVAGIATTMIFDVQPTDSVAGAAFQPDVQVGFLDASGHPTTQGAVPVALVLGGGSQGGALSGNATVNPVAGIAAFPGLSIQKAGDGYTLMATASGFFPVTSTPFNVAAGAPMQLGFAVQPSNVVAGAVMTPAVEVQIEDAFGNVVPHAMETVTLQLEGETTGAVLGGPVTGVPVNGVAGFVGLVINRAGTGYTLSATASPLTGATSTSFAVTAGSPKQLGFVVPPSSVQAGATITPAVAVAVEDTFGNTVPSATSSITLTLGGCSQGSGLTGTRTFAAVNGVATFTGLAVQTAGTCTLTAADATDAPGTSPPFQVTSAPPAKLTFLVQPSNVVAATPMVPAVQVAIVDAFGNATASMAPVTLMLSTATGPGRLSGVAQVNAIAGTATFSDVEIDQTASGDVLVATAPGYAGVTSNTFDVSTGAPSATQSTIGANPGQLTADGTSVTTLTVTVKDAGGNPLGGQDIQLAVSGTGNDLLPASGLSAPDGTFTATLSSTTAETKTVTATIGPVQFSTTVTFQPGALAPARSSVSVSPPSVTADGSTQAAITVVAEDAEGNPIPGGTVSLSTSGSANVFTPAMGTLNTAGSFVATVTSTKAQTETVTATIGGVALSTSLTFVPGPPSATRSTLGVNPPQVPANGAAETTLLATARDAQGNLIGGLLVGFSSSVPGDTPTPLTATTGSDGTATASLASTKSGTRTVTATLGMVPVSAHVTFLAGAPVASRSEITVTPPSETADGVAQATIAVTLEDSNGNPCSGQTVFLSADGASNTFFPQQGTTGPSGVFSAGLSSTLAQSETITASAGALTFTAPIVFVPGPPSTQTSTFVVAPNGVTADGVSTDTLAVTVEDANGNRIAGQAVSLATAGQANAFTPMQGATDSNGVFASTLASTVALSETVSASIGGGTVPATVSFVAGPPSQATSTLTANPTTTYSDGYTTSTLTVTVEDVFGNPVSGQSVSLASNVPQDVLGMTSGVTGDGGTVSTTILSPVQGVHTITATVGTFTVQTSILFVSQFNLGAGGGLTTTQPSVASAAGLQVFGGLEYAPLACTGSHQFCVSGGIVP